MTIWRVTFQTPNFTFEAFDTNEADAREGLRRAWVQHCTETHADPNYLENYASDIYAQEITLGVTYRDRETYRAARSGTGGGPMMSEVLRVKEQLEIAKRISEQDYREADLPGLAERLADLVRYEHDQDFREANEEVNSGP